MNRTFPIFAAIAAISAIVIVAGSWAPFERQPNEAVEVWRLFMQQGSSSLFSRSDVVTNFWLGFPFVIGMSGLVQAHRGSRIRRLGWISVILAVQACLSLTAELGQGWFAGRVSSVADCILQLAGAISATLVWQWIGRRVDSKLQLVLARSSNNPVSSRLDAALNLAATGVLVWTIMPLDVIVSPVELGKEFLKTELVPFTRLEADLSENVYQWIASFFLAIPLGLWLSRRLAKYYSGKLSFITVALIAIATGVLPEVCQFPIDSRVASATDALFGILGALAGILIGSQFSSTRFRTGQHGLGETVRTPAFWFGLAIVQAVVICAIAWMPFDFAAKPREVAKRIEQFLSSPFSAFGGSDLLTGLTLYRQAILAVVMGLFIGMAYRYLRLKYPYSVVGGVIMVFSMIVFSAGVEFVQLVVNSRSGEAIGIFIRSAGSLLGLIASMAFSIRD